MFFPSLILQSWLQVFALCAFLVALGAWCRIPSKAARLPYPPAPQESSWLGGNIEDMPRKSPWKHLNNLGKDLGNLIHIRLYGQHNIVINDYETATKLLKSRSNIYSDRPQSAMSILTGRDSSTIFKPYGAEWQTERVLLHQVFKPNEPMSHKKIQVQKTINLLNGLIESPGDFRGHIQTFGSAVITSVVSGHDLSSKDVHYVRLLKAAFAKISLSTFPGMFAVNSLPILRYLPRSFPGADFHHFARGARNLIEQTLNSPFASVEKAKGMAGMRSCVATDLLKSCKLETERAQIKSVCDTIYTAGVDPIISSLEIFFFAVAQFVPEQRKAQAEIDRVIGNTRLLTLDDRASLPYVEALYREVLRWMPAIPFGVAHATTDEDIYDEYYIPKGASVIPNVWAMTRNPDRYPDPECFNPDRFITEEGRLTDDDMQYAFGFGQRICPGRHFASSTIWLALANILMLFELGKKRDSQGNDIPIDTDFTTGLVTHPQDFVCSIRPRSESARQVIQDAACFDAPTQS